MNTVEPDLSWFSWSHFTLGDSHRLQVISLLADSDERLLRFLFDLRSPRLRTGVDQLLQEAQCLSHGEQLMVRAAIELWCGCGEFCLNEALQIWDEQHLVGLIRAICHLKEIREPVLHALIDDQNGGFCL